MHSIFRRPVLCTSCLVLLLLAGAPSARAATLYKPGSAAPELTPLAAVEVFAAETVDPRLELIEDDQRERLDLPLRIAVPRETFISPETDGRWEYLDPSTQIWRYRVSSPGAVSLNLGFSRMHLPADARLFIYGIDAPGEALRYDISANKPHGQLWTPIVKGDELVIEIIIPVKARAELDVLLSSVNVGYRELGSLVSDKSGGCNIDVACPEGDPWRTEIQSVAVYSFGGGEVCTGFMVNNTANDGTPYFMTANHCAVNPTNAPSMVIYWNFQSPGCGLQDGGSLAMNQSGATWLAANAKSDFVLVELDDLPDPTWNVSYAGWNRSSNNPTSATAIHHPSTDEKSISFEYDPTMTTTYEGYEPPGNGTHIRIVDWDLGTTERGSSGSPLFDQNHLVVGQLHGGWAACDATGTGDNGLSDWYGRFSVSWNNGSSPSERLQDWLDPLGTGQLTLPTLPSGFSGLAVSPLAEILVEGEQGGPFSPTIIEYTISNDLTETFDFEVETTAGWLTITGGTGTLDPGEEAVVHVSLNGTTATLDLGLYTADIVFRNPELAGLESRRSIKLLVGTPAVFASWNMEADPGWQTEGAWSYGAAITGPVEYGHPDPQAGATGDKVFGYARGGTYAPDMPRFHLTTGAIDCTNMVYTHLTFKRWLNVERPQYDRASISMSTDGRLFIPIWENQAEITDNEWIAQSFDISDLADNEPQVWLRWTMGATDGSWEYSGWNLDDVQITAVNTSPKRTLSPMAQILDMSDITPNPFNPSTRLSFRIARQAATQLDVVDIRGRRIRQLRNEVMQAGRYSETWNGRDDQDREVGSGTYFFRLTSGSETMVRKAVLVR